MNRDHFAGCCKQLVGKIQAQWGRLTDDALSVDAGERTQFFGRIQQQYGDSKEQAARQLREFLKRNRDWNTSQR